MRFAKLFLFLLSLVVSAPGYSQITFEKGYYIDNENNRKECFIKNNDWLNNPSSFEYKDSEDSEVKVADIKSVREFGIGNSSKYTRSIVQMDKSSQNISELTDRSSPKFIEEEIFLKALVEGKASLFSYYNKGLEKYFYQIENSPIEQLLFIRYQAPSNKIGENTTYKQQLFKNVMCSTLANSDVTRLTYKKKKLVTFFVAYNECSQADFTNYEERQKRNSFNLSLKPRFNYASICLENSPRNMEFGYNESFGIGVEAEFVLPLNKNKWSIIIDPTYQRLIAERITDSPNLLGGKLLSQVNYQSIEVPLGLRYYLFLNENSKLFINTAFIYDFSLGSTIEFRRADDSILESLDIESQNNLAFGLGYNLHNKYHIELRYQTKRQLFRNYFFWNAYYNSFSLIFGYSII